MRSYNQLKNNKQISNELYSWLKSWTFEKRAPNLTPELIDEMKKFIPKHPLKLYRFQDVNIPKKPLESWTHDPEMVKYWLEFGEEKNKEVISETISPEKILIDFTLLPEPIKKDFLNEIIVKNI